MNQGSGAAPEPRGGLNRRRDHLGPTHWRAEMTIGAQPGIPDHARRHCEYSDRLLARTIHEPAACGRDLRAIRGGNRPAAVLIV